MAWTATPAGKAVSRVDFKVDGSAKWTETGAPWVFNGDGRTLNTATLANGSHTLAVTAYATDGTSATTSATVTVANTAPAGGSGPAPSVANGSSSPTGGAAPAAPAGAALKTPPAPTTLEVKPYVIEWDGRLFQTMGAFRSYIIGLGMDWSGFLARHPGVADRGGLPFVQWDGMRFYDQESLTRQLAKRKISFAGWVSNHPIAGAILAGRPVEGVQRTAAQVLQKPVAITWAGVGFTTADGLRSYVERQGEDWNRFLAKHPAAAKRLALASVTWEGKQFYTRSALSRWLTGHKGNLARWQKAHPGMAEKLMA